MLQFNPQAAQSRVTNDWLSDIYRRFPAARIMTRDANGAETWTGNIRSPLVRLSFPHLFKPQAAMEAGKDPQFMVTSLYPAGADISLLSQIVQETATAEWGAGAAQMQLHSPFRDQGEKAAKYGGYVPGSVFITSSAGRKPPVVDQNLAPIVDEARVYPGVWGFVTYRCFAYNAKNPQGHVVKRGVSFGLQSVMIVADDENLGGGGSDPNQDFAGVNIEASVNPAGLFQNHGMTTPAAPQPATAAYVPVQPATAAYVPVQPAAPTPPAAPQPAAFNPPPAPAAPPAVPRPTDPTHIHNAGQPDEMWWHNGAWVLASTLLA